LVTGGSRGIGAASCLLAARQGWSVAVNYTAHSLAADEVVREIRAAGGRAMAVQADVADEAQVLRMFEQVDAKLGRLTGLVNNAGHGLFNSLETVTEAQFDGLLNAHLKGPFFSHRLCCR